MKDRFSIDDMALITRLSTRTIRNYIADGFLEGDKSSGAWQFTAEQVDAFCRINRSCRHCAPKKCDRV